MVTTLRLGGTASNIEVANVAHGLMRMTWTTNPVSDAQAFQAIKDGVDAAGGAKVYLNGGTFYAQDFGPANLELLSRFYEAYPEYAERTVLCIKGGVKQGTIETHHSEETLRRTFDVISTALRGTKHLDVYENARIDPSRPIEETFAILKKLKEEGKFDHLAMSECNAETLRRGNAVEPITHVEVEVSPFCYDDTNKEVIATARELSIPVLAYGVQAAGFLTGQIRSPDNFPEGDFRKGFDRFQPENFYLNLQLVDRITELAKAKGVTPATFNIAWVRSLGPHMLPLLGSSKSTRTIENLRAGDVNLTKEEIEAVNDALKKIPVQGDRYTKDTDDLML